MEQVPYIEEILTSMPTSTFVQEQIHDLREEILRLEEERDEMLWLLHEVSEVDVFDDFEDLLARVRDFVDCHPYPRTD